MKVKTILKRFGPALFLFYLVKGLAWLIIPAIIAANAVSD